MSNFSDQLEYGKYLGVAMNALQVMQDPLWSDQTVEAEVEPNAEWATLPTANCFETSANPINNSSEDLPTGHFESSLNDGFGPFPCSDIIGYTVTLNESGNEVCNYYEDLQPQPDASISNEECAETKQLEANVEQNDSSQATSKLRNKVCQSKKLDKLDSDQGIFQGVFKSLRSRSVVYSAIAGESKDADLSFAAKKHSSKSNKASYPYRCDNCDHVFKFFSLLLNHVKKHGSTPRSFSCNACKFSGDKRAIKRHVLLNH